jgi:hypothetical protein
LCEIEFLGGVTSSFGWPNDEALHAHALNDKGLEPYAAYEVLDSSWLSSVEQRNREAFPKSRFTLKHFIFSFHDSTFECLARDFRMKTHALERPDVVGNVIERIISSRRLKT